MTDSRKRRATRRRVRQHQTAKTDADAMLAIIRKALAKNPLELLSLASYLVSRGTTDDGWSLESLITNFAVIRRRETTALLIVLAELLDDGPLRERCHREVATRNHHLPKWIVGLEQVTVGRVMRRTNILGDGDELAIGLVLPGGTELTLGAFLDHNYLSAAIDVNLSPQPVDRAIAHGRGSADPQTIFVDMDPADARAWMENGLRSINPSVQPDAWRERLPLVRWLLAQLPGGGTAYERPEWDNEAMAALLDAFFASPAGAPFADAGYRELLTELCDSGYGDPLRWSVRRVSSVLRDPFFDHLVPLEIEVDAPALLRAFIVFAHARSAIGQDLTDEAITTIDELSLRYKRTLIADAAKYYDDDDFGLPPWRDRAS